MATAKKHHESDDAFEVRVTRLMAHGPTEDQIYAAWAELQERDELKYSDLWFDVQNRVSQLVENE